MSVLRDYLVQLGFASVTALLMSAVVACGYLAVKVWDAWLKRCADLRTQREHEARRQALGRAVSAPRWQRDV